MKAIQWFFSFEWFTLQFYAWGVFFNVVIPFMFEGERNDEKGRAPILIMAVLWPLDQVARITIGLRYIVTDILALRSEVKQ